MATEAGSTTTTTTTSNIRNMICSPCCVGGDDRITLNNDGGEEMISFLGGQRQRNRSKRELPSKDYESLNYVSCYNEPYDQMLQTLSHKDVKMQEGFKWVLMFVIGAMTALVALFIDVGVKRLTWLKLYTVDKYIEEGFETTNAIVAALFIMIAFNGGFVALASLLTVFEPMASGSGIPEIKCYLNGVRIPRVMRLKTLLIKACGVLFSVAGGLFVGKEGPMIHSGAIIGSGIPQFQCLACGKQLNYSHFRTDRDKRDFVSSGAAAGVAAAFGAPIGGVLFSLEEGSSFWNQTLTWRTLFCSMSATFVLNFFLSGIDSAKNWGAFYEPGLLNFGIFECGHDCDLWRVKDLLIIIAIGVGGGLFGALFNAINTHLTKFRIRTVNTHSIAIRLCEAVLVGVCTTIVTFVASMALGQCRPIVSSGSNVTELRSTLRTYFCKDDEYNDMATLFFNSQEIAIKQLFHQEGTFSLMTLGLFFIFFFVLACWTYGIMVPSGLFLPSLVCGAAYGRFVAILIENIGLGKIYHGTLSLIGAAAFLGGVVRMTISLTVILIESTNEISYGLPILITLMVAKWVGDLFNEGLYDIHIHLKNIPFLEWSSSKLFHNLQASDIMETDLSYIYPHTRVQSIVSILRTTAHNAFPVVTVNSPENDDRLIMRNNVVASNNIGYKKESVKSRAEYQRSTSMNINSTPFYGATRTSTVEVDQVNRTIRSQTLPQASVNVERSETIDANLLEDRSDIYLRPDIDESYKSLLFHGIILREQLVSLLKRHVYYSEDKQNRQPYINHFDLNSDYPRCPDINDIVLATLNPRCIMDVTPYMNTSPHIIQPKAPVPEVFNLFRTMGLRHLPCINATGEVVGIITRHNLTHEFMTQKQQQMGH